MRGAVLRSTETPQRGLPAKKPRKFAVRWQGKGAETMPFPNPGVPVSQHARPQSHAVPEAASAARSQPSPSNIKRWRQYLADERAEAAVYRDLAQNREGEERSILLALAEAEGRHEAHWLALLGEHAGKPKRASARSRFLGFLARHFGSVFVLALAQRAEGRSPYAKDPNATAAMAADEQIHEEVVRGLATRGRNRLAGTFRAAVFGANDGLVSNLSLVMGMVASGAIVPIVPFLFGLTGVLALVVSAALVGIALLLTGGVVGLLSGTSPVTRGLRQLGIGLGAAAVTYLLGMAFGAV